MMSNFEDVLKLLSEKHTEEVSYYRNQLEELKRQHHEEIKKLERQYNTKITKAKAKIRQKSQETQKLRELLTQNRINVPSLHELISTDEFRSNLSHLVTNDEHIVQEESTHNEEAPPTNHASITSTLSHSPITPSTSDTSKRDTPTLCTHSSPVVQSPHRKSLQTKPKHRVVYRESGPKKETMTTPQHSPSLICDTECIIPASVNGEDTNNMELSSKSSEDLEILSNETTSISPAGSEALFTSHYQNEQEIDETLDEIENVVSPSLLKELDNIVTPEQNPSISTNNITSILDDTSSKLSQSSCDPENVTNVKKRRRKNQPTKKVCSLKKRKKSNQTTMTQHINTSTIDELCTKEEDIPVVITPPLLEDNDVTMMISSDEQVTTHQDLSPDKLNKSFHIVPPTPWVKPLTSKPQYPWQQELISGIIPVTSSPSTNCNIVPPQPNNTMTSPLKRPSSDALASDEIIECNRHDNKSSSHITQPPNDKQISQAKKIKTNSHKNTGVTKKFTEEQKLAKRAGLPTFSCVVSIRRKDDRAKLPGTACPDCTKWFQGGHGIYENEQEHLLKACRHKHLYKPPESDPSLWKIGFPESPDSSDS